MHRSLNVLIVILLIFLGLFFPLIGLIGIILMWKWLKWRRWIKILITIPYLIYLLLYLLLSFAVLAYLTVARPYQVFGNAMAPNYKDKMYTMTKIVKPEVVLQRGDVVIYSTMINDVEVTFIKRVIGLPGETLMISDGFVYVNNQKLDEVEYLPTGTQTLGGGFIQEGTLITIPTNQYFLLGDNRTHSSDSRQSGLISRSQITSKVLFCYWNCK